MSAEQAHNLLCRFQHLVKAVPLWPAIYESSTSDGQILYTVRQGEGDDSSLFSVQATLQDVTLRSLYELLSRVENRKLWDTSFEAGQVLGELSNDFSAASIEYIRLAGIFPVVKQRDMVVLSVNAQTAPSQIISASTSVQSLLAPVKKGYQRFHLSIGGCMLREVTNGVELTQITDIGDLVKWTPAYVIRTCTQVLVPRFLSKFRKEALALASTLDTYSTIEWQPPLWSQARQTPPASVIIPEHLELSTPLEDAHDLETAIEESHDGTLMPRASDYRDPQCDSPDQTMTAETVASPLATSGHAVERSVEAEEGRSLGLYQSGDDEVSEAESEGAQEATVFAQLQSASTSGPVSDSSSHAEVTVVDNSQEDRLSFEPPLSSPLILPRPRGMSTELSHPELAMRRLSYFGGGEDQFDLEEELGNILPEALDSSTGIQAAHRLSKAFSQLELARRYGDERVEEESTCNREESKSEEPAPSVNEETRLIQEIRDAAQPFFGASSIEGLLFTPSTHLAVAASSKQRQVPPSWQWTLSSVLYYLPGSTLFTRPRR